MIEVLQALLTPVIALFALSIALAQWWTARNRFKLDLFDRRWAVYVATREILSAMFTHAQTSEEEQRKFLLGIRGAEWLFDERVESYLRKELWWRVTHLEGANNMLQPGANECDRHTASKNKCDILLWVTAQDEVIDALFGDFLKMDQQFSEWVFSHYRRVWRPG